MANVKVRLKDASNNVLHPETDWSVVLNKPSIKPKYNDGSQDTGAESVVNTVAGIVGPGEAWDTYSNGGKSIVIGNSDNALGFCGTNSKRLFTMFQSKHNIDVAANGSINMSATGDINIKSKETNNQSVPLGDYPIKWSAINGKPSGTYVRSVTSGTAASAGNMVPAGGVTPGIYFYTGVPGSNLFAFVWNDSEAIWGWYYDTNGQKQNLPDNVLRNGTNLVKLAVDTYVFNAKNF